MGKKTGKIAEWREKSRRGNRKMAGKIRHGRKITFIPL
jgi:hypothetical protein